MLVTLVYGGPDAGRLKKYLEDPGPEGFRSAWLAIVENRFGTPQSESLKRFAAWGVESREGLVSAPDGNAMNVAVSQTTEVEGRKFPEARDELVGLLEEERKRLGIGTIDLFAYLEEIPGSMQHEMSVVLGGT